MKERVRTNQPQRRGPGRPKGSKNKRSGALRDRLLEKHGIDMIDEWALMWKGANALKEGRLQAKLDLWKAGMPYVEARLSVIQVDPQIEALELYTGVYIQEATPPENRKLRKG